MKNDGAVALSMAFVVFFFLGLFVLDASVARIWMPPVSRNVYLITGLFALMTGGLIMWMPVRRKWVAALVGISLLAGVVMALMEIITAPVLPVFATLLGVLAVRLVSKEEQKENE